MRWIESRRAWRHQRPGRSRLATNPECICIVGIPPYCVHGVLAAAHSGAAEPQAQLDTAWPRESPRPSIWSPGSACGRRLPAARGPSRQRKCHPGRRPRAQSRLHGPVTRPGWSSEPLDACNLLLWTALWARGRAATERGGGGQSLQPGLSLKGRGSLSVSLRSPVPPAEILPQPPVDFKGRPGLLQAHRRPPASHCRCDGHFLLPRAAQDRSWPPLLSRSPRMGTSRGSSAFRIERSRKSWVGASSFWFCLLEGTGKAGDEKRRGQCWGILFLPTPFSPGCEVS